MIKYTLAFIFTTILPAYAITDDELENLEKICTAHYIGKRAPAGPVEPFKWMPGWEKCIDIHSAYTKAAPGIAAKAKSLQDEIDRQKINDAFVK